MAALQCEICGGKLIGKPGGIFVCDSCGVEYDTSWAKAKVQEIKGKVQIEGPVEVTGRVQIDGTIGGPSAENLVKRGFICLQDQDWISAERFFDRALDIDAQCAEAYLGLFMTQNQLPTKETFSEVFVCGDVKVNQNLVRARDYAAADLKTWFDKLGDKKAIYEAKRRIHEIADEKYRSDNKPLVIQKRRFLAPLRGMIAASYDHVSVLRLDGRVLTAEMDKKEIHDTSEWSNIVELAGKVRTIGLKNTGQIIISDPYGYKGPACQVENLISIATDGYNIVGLRFDGTVNEVTSWKNIVSVTVWNRIVVGIKNDGTLVIAGAENYFNPPDCSSWKEIVTVLITNSAGSPTLFGLTNDGRVLMSSGKNRVISHWRDVVDISGGDDHIVALKLDGKVVATGNNDYGQCDVSGWSNVVAIAASRGYSVGLCSDGTILTAGSFLQYSNMGSVVRASAVDLSGWKLFDDIGDALEKRKNQRDELLSNIKESLEVQRKREQFIKKNQEERAIRDTQSSKISNREKQTNYGFSYEDNLQKKYDESVAVHASSFLNFIKNDIAGKMKNGQKNGEKIHGRIIALVGSDDPSDRVESEKIRGRGNFYSKEMLSCQRKTERRLFETFEYNYYELTSIFSDVWEALVSMAQAEGIQIDMPIYTFRRSKGYIASGSSVGGEVLMESKQPLKRIHSGDYGLKGGLYDYRVTIDIPYTAKAQL